MVTSACHHDSPELETRDRGQQLYTGSIDDGQEAVIDECEMTNQVHEKGTKSNPLTEAQKASSRQKSTSQARVEHVVGFMTNSMKAIYVRTIGYVQAVAKIGLANLTYNLMRCTQINKKSYHIFLRGYLRPVIAEPLLFCAMIPMNRRFAGHNSPVFKSPFLEMP